MPHLPLTDRRKENEPVLTTQEVSRFQNAGFLAITEPIISPVELDRLRAIYDAMFADRSGREDGNQFDLAGVDDDSRPAGLSQILHPQHYRPDIAGGYVETVALLARQLLGEQAVTEIFHAILKPAGFGVPTPWHQDEAYWSPDRQYRSISIWIPLQEATVENGCLWFVDGSHEWDVLEHRPIGGDRRVHGLEMVDTSPVVDPVACPLPAGGATIHRNRTAHYAGPNTTGMARRALILGANLPDRPYPVERRFHWQEDRQTGRDERAKAAGKSGVMHVPGEPALP
jgi:hypothetical protein